MQRRDLLVASAMAACLPARAQVKASAFANGALRGFDIGGPSHLDEAGVLALAATGANLARVAFPLRRCAGCAAFTHDESDEKALSQLLDRCGARGIGVVIVAWFDGVQEPGFWVDTGLQDAAVREWAWLAGRFGSHPAVSGLDLLNEPNPPWPGRDLAKAQALWLKLAQAMIWAIRQAGAVVPIVFEPVAGASPLGLRDAVPPKDANLVCSIHMYLPHAITHQRVAPEWPGVIAYPTPSNAKLAGGDPSIPLGPFDKARLERELAPARAFQLKHGLPIYVGEFSCVRWAPGRSAQAWLADCLELFTAWGWSWTYHEFRGWPGWDAEIDSTDPAVTTRSPQAPSMRLLDNALRRR
jgi:hypothetical protein